MTHWGDVTIGHKTGPAYAEMKYDWRKDYYWSDVILLESMFSHRYENYQYSRDFLPPAIEQVTLEMAINQPMRWEVNALSGTIQCGEGEAFNLLKQKIGNQKQLVLNYHAKRRLMEKPFGTSPPVHGAGVPRDALLTDRERYLRDCFDLLLARQAFCRDYIFGGRRQQEPRFKLLA